MNPKLSGVKTSKGLFNDRKELENGSISRGAAVFPLFDLELNNLYLTFQNYWKWKRDVYVEYKITIRNLEGKSFLELSNNEVKDVNLISLRDIVNKNQIHFSNIKNGLVEIEIHSKENIVYPFPAIIGVYKSNSGFISAVHTCGRTLEKGVIDRRIFSETNFYVFKSERFIPFIHLFNGETGAIENIRILIYCDSNSQPLKVIKIPPLRKSYQSNLIHVNLNDLEEKHFSSSSQKKDFNLINFEKSASYFIKIEGESSSIFPRFLCGNYDLLNKNYCVTHTFREVNFEGDTIENCIDETQKSFVSLPIVKDKLRLKAIVYPTTSPSSLKVKIDTRYINDLKTISSSNIKDLSAKSCQIYTKNVISSDSPGLVATAFPNNEQNQLPARIAINLMYYLESGMNTMPPEIAHQMSTYLTGYKKNYWYSGIIFDGYDNIILGSSITSNSLSNCKAEDINFEFILRLQNDDNIYKRDFDLNSNESKSFKISIEDTFRFFNLDLENQTAYSWRIKVKKGNMGALYCLSYNDSLGCIYGEHSF